MPVYAECGGLMYLGRQICDLQGQEHSMVGVIPVSSKLEGPKRSLGYRTVQALEDNPILRRGETVRGHEFHWSVLDNSSGIPNAYDIVDRGPRREGYLINGLLASYVHVHFGALSSIAPRFVEKCREFHEQSASLNSGKK